MSWDTDFFFRTEVLCHILNKWSCLHIGWNVKVSDVAIQHYFWFGSLRKGAFPELKIFSEVSDVEVQYMWKMSSNIDFPSYWNPSSYFKYKIMPAYPAIQHYCWYGSLKKRYISWCLSEKYSTEFLMLKFSTCEGWVRTFIFFPTKVLRHILNIESCLHIGGNVEVSDVAIWHYCWYDSLKKGAFPGF